MGVAERSIPGLDVDGFIARSALRVKARALDASGFAKAYDAPALLILDQLAEAVTPAKEAKRAAGVNIVTMDSGASTGSKAVERYRDGVFFVTKRPGNPFPHMFSVGRTASCDITIAVETVSKLHGYFLRDGDEWSYR